MSDDDPDLSAVAADAALLDALAAGSAGGLDDLADDQALSGLAALRAALDDDLLLAGRAAPLQAAPVGDVVALRRPSGRRRGGRAAVLAAGAALALSSTGVAAATYDARPGDPLYGLRTAVAGPRAEDPQLLRKRLDAVQQQLRSPDAATRSAVREELAEVAALLAELEPGQRGNLEQRYATLLERLADAAPDTDAPPAGPPAGQPRPPTEQPGQSRTPDNRPDPSRSSPSAPPAQRPSATPDPSESRPSPQASRPSPRPSASTSTARPSPRTSQAVPSTAPPRAGQPDGAGRPSPAPPEELTTPG